MSDEPNDRLNVTLVVWQGLTAILPQMGQGVGGLEVCAWRLAKSLADDPDIDSQIIVRSPGGWRSNVSSRIIDGVKVTFYRDPREYIRREVSACVRIGRRPKLLRFSPKLLWQLPYLAFTWPFRTRDPIAMEPDPRLISWKPDAWVTFGASKDAAGVAAVAGQQNRPLLLMLQSNSDLDPRYVSEPDWRSAYGEVGAHCHYAITHASEIACQTDVQAALLREHFGREGVIVRNLTDAAAFREAAESPGDYVLWIGRYDKVHKRPHLAIEVAKQCPDVKFRMVINPSDEQVKLDIHAACPPNVKLIDYVPFNEQPQLFGQARMFFSTGSADYEGFPTVLLQSVAANKPIVSLDDFDGFIQSSRSGRVVGDDLTKAAMAIQSYWDDPSSYDPSHASEYLDQHHTIDAISSQVISILRRLAG